MQNIPKIKVGIVSVSRDCFPESLALNRISALVKAYEKKYGKGDIYQCPVCIVESEIHMKQALADIVNNGCNALCVYLGNFGPEISETMLAQQYAASPRAMVCFTRLSTAFRRWLMSALETSGCSIQLRSIRLPMEVLVLSSTR